MEQATPSLREESVHNPNICESLNKFQKHDERRFVLIGKTGTGKSSLGNAILGKQAFANEGPQMQSNTIKCQFARCEGRFEKNIVVVDTPGLMDTRRKPAEIFDELCLCTTFVAPGPHAICLVIRGDDRFTQENIGTLDDLCAFFGEEIYKYLLVVFTHKNGMGKNVKTDDCLELLPDDFKMKFLKFGGWSIAVECKAKKRVLTKQINELLSKIEEMIKRNNDGYYSEEKSKAAEEAFRMRIPKILQQVDEMFVAKKNSLNAKYQKKIANKEEKERELQTKLQKLEESIKSKDQSNEKDKEKLQRCAEKIDKVRNEKDKLKVDHDRELNDIEKKVNQAFSSSYRADRDQIKVVLAKTGGFARKVITEGAGVAYDLAPGVIKFVVGTAAQALQ